MVQHQNKEEQSQELHCLQAAEQVTIRDQSVLPWPKWTRYNYLYSLFHFKMHVLAGWQVGCRLWPTFHISQQTSSHILWFPSHQLLVSHGWRLLGVKKVWQAWQATCIPGDSCQQRSHTHGSPALASQQPDKQTASDICHSGHGEGHREIWLV